MELKKNQIITCEVTDVNSFGHGVTRADGIVVFVQNGVTGDRADVRIIKVAKNYAVARIESLHTPSPHRIEPDCPAFRSCGGCQFRHVEYEYERELKRKFVREAFRRAGLDGVEVDAVESNGATLRYRNKAQFPFVMKDGRVRCGFFSERTHRVVPIADCPIQDARFAPICAFVCDFLTMHGVSVYDETKGTGLARHLYLRVGKGSGDISLVLVLTSDTLPHEEKFVRELTVAFPEIVSVSVNINPKQTNVILGHFTRLLFGKPYIEDILCGRRFRISPASFYQVNHDMAEKLYQKAFELSRLQAGETLLDLYCGIGTISLSAARPDLSVFGVETVPDAVRNARENASLNGIERAKYVCSDAACAFDHFTPEDASRTVVLVDPPRKGLAQDLIDALSERAFPRIVYISCNPETLARDLSLFCSHGWRFGTVFPFDLFPGTTHVETVTLITRAGS